MQASRSYNELRVERHKPILHAVVGAAFLGTPFRGSWDAGNAAAKIRVTIAESAAKSEGRQISRELIQYLRMGTTIEPGPLDQLVDEFTQLVADNQFQFPMTCFFETAPTKHQALIDRFPEGHVQTEIDPDGQDIVRLASRALFF